MLVSDLRDENIFSNTEVHSAPFIHGDGEFNTEVHSVPFIHGDGEFNTGVHSVPVIHGDGELSVSHLSSYFSDPLVARQGEDRSLWFIKILNLLLLNDC